MATTNVPAQQAPQQALVAAPDFMEADQQLGTETLSQKVRPPFLKLVQKQSSNELIDQFGIGSAILVPDRMPVLTLDGGPVRIVPIFFFVEYLKLSPIILKDTEPMIVDRSFDPRSELARKAQDRRLWVEPHPNYPGDHRYDYRNAEALCFLCMFQEPHLQIGMPFVLSFMKGSYGKGQQFCNLISMRKRPPFGCVFHLGIDPVPGRSAQGEWRRYLIENPPEEPWVVDPAEYAVYKEQYLLLKHAHASSNIETTYDDETDGMTVDPTTADTGGF